MKHPSKWKLTLRVSRKILWWFAEDLGKQDLSEMLRNLADWLNPSWVETIQPAVNWISRLLG
ncbi:MAG: hypothetical protein RRB13_06220 [bacterium]|nr:hypothetical protein [bacterium]